MVSRLARNPFKHVRYPRTVCTESVGAETPPGLSRQGRLQTWPNTGAASHPQVM